MREGLTGFVICMGQDSGNRVGHGSGLSGTWGGRIWASPFRGTQTYGPVGPGRGGQFVAMGLVHRLEPDGVPESRGAGPHITASQTALFNLPHRKVRKGSPRVTRGKLEGAEGSPMADAVLEAFIAPIGVDADGLQHAMPQVPRHRLRGVTSRSVRPTTLSGRGGPNLSASTNPALGTSPTELPVSQSSSTSNGTASDTGKHGVFQG